MTTVPLYDFDEAHRAENAKRMKEYSSFFVPLTGSPQDRVEHLKVLFKENPDHYLYYHLERPPLVYDLMIISTSFFGNVEWAYRLPSFLLGMSTIGVFIWFARRETKYSVFALAAGFLVLSTSDDLWLSSQYAQMDTAITFFQNLSLLILIFYCKTKKPPLIYLAGAFFGLALLSKLQPTVIFIFPLLCLLFLRMLNIKELFKFILGTLVIFLPWVGYLIYRFGIVDVVGIIPGFAITSASIDSIHHEAPFFWYARWWWESLRPGWTLFLAFFFYELISGKLNWEKKTLLTYIFGGLIAFSIPINKLWWYVLPLVPAVAFYVYLSVKDYLADKPNRITNLSFSIIVASLPLFLGVSNKLSLIYGISVTVLVFLILTDRLNIKISSPFGKRYTFYIAVVASLLFFLLRFPQIVPYHRHTKPVSEYYKNLPDPKCLWLGDMPGEAALFYSEAGELPLLNKSSQVYAACKNNYLITPDRYNQGELLIRQGNMRLYKL